MKTRGDRFLRLIALERGLRAIVLVAVGVVLLTHLHTDWSHQIQLLAQRMGLDTSSQGIHHLLVKIQLLSPHQLELFGLVAIGYGVLEGVEGYGLWYDKPWAEHLTVIATSLLFIPEIWELTKRVTLLKVGGLIVNIVVVDYLIVRLRRRGRDQAGESV